MKTREEMLEQIASGSCDNIKCTHCPLRITGGKGLPGYDSPKNLPIKIREKAKNMIIDKEIEEFLGG